jgi:hypothetical protein
MRKVALATSLVAAFFVAAPAASADPTSNVLPVQLTCGSQTFNIVAPANGRSSAGLYVNSTSVAVLMGVDDFLVPGFTADDLTECTAVFSGGSFTAFVLITPRA